ncbi:MAG: hypothetical protein ACR2JF_15200 [Iamia sp.]
MPVATDARPGAEPTSGVAGRLEAIEAELAELADELVPERIPGQVLARVVRSLGRIERRAGGARLVLTKAAADLGAWKGQGYRSPEEWAARANGTSTAQAKADLKASERLAALPAARAAARSGELSTDAAKAVAEGASADPATEGDLLGSAKKGDLGEVRDKARRARQRADERDGKAAERMFRRRALRTWLELDGEGRGSWNVPPEYHARFLAALEPYRQEAFRLAREAGRRETPEALMADALDLLARDTIADLNIPDPTAPADDAADEARGGEADAGSTGPANDDDPSFEAADREGATTARPASSPGQPASGPGDTQAGDAADGTEPDHADTCHQRGRAGDDTLFGAEATGSDPEAHTAGHPGAAASERGRAANDPQTDPSDPMAGRKDATEAEAATTDPSDPMAGRDHPAPTGTAAAEPARRAPGTPRPTEKPRGAGNRRAAAQLVVHASYDALIRGFPVEGEVCEIPGLGPVPVAFARFLATDCLLRVVITGAMDVTVISSERRYVPADLRAALEARDPECVVPGCHARHHLERDHWGSDFAQGGPTSLANLARLCRYHHYLKTHCGWVLSGGPGHWRFEPP